MYEDLIEKIEAYKLACEDDDAMPNVDDVIVIIMQAEPLILDIPNDDGWWWFEDEWHKYPCIIKGGVIQDFIHPTTFNLEKYINSYKGKWQKIPEPKGVVNELDRAD